MVKVKSKHNKAKTTVKKHKKSGSSVSSASGGNDVASRRKWERGGRVEAYTFGEALGKKRWP